ncbi:hypothetical protein G3N55_00070 [Dissulfurirhabdus thermomarina]|uniref:Phage tail protein n=1 Tax=Dissulfurirhabdus thermomarina TaxID=1765737 RepID=A0A6N9TJ20_DISTH|nr:contractile injection system protein, VgrG/Pvc8 family [Dissulfurirhabdus thermomarina]NDY41245.1 hypothetical protein [Dissulfurirhabdus thermomarina]
MPDVVLTANGERFAGWDRVRLTRSIEALAGAFEVGVSGPAAWIPPGAACTVALDGEVLLTGWVDQVAVRYGPSSHQVTVSGRDRTGDLVDCSAAYGSGQWRAPRTLDQIARDLLRPYGIEVVVDADVGSAYPSAAIQAGETVFETLDRLARLRGVLLTSDGLGRLVLTRASSRRIATPLVRGENILEADATISHKDRHSAYRVLAQSPGGDGSTPEQNAHASAAASDPGVARHRPLVILAEDRADAAACRARAEWEAAVRYGRSARAVVTVQGWRHADGLWAPNRLVRVRDEWLRLDGDMLVVAVAYLLDEQGSRTQLTLARPEAYTPAPPPAPKEEADPWS